MKTGLNRRRFLQEAAVGAAAGGAALIGSPNADAQSPQVTPPRGTASPPSARALAAETEPVSVETNGLTVDDPGSDFMVDVLKTLGFEYIAANPGSSFRGLHESFINYGGNKSARVAHLLPRGIVGRHRRRLLQGRRQADGGRWRTAPSACSTRRWPSTTPSSARVPVFIILGNTLDANARRPGVEWTHSVQDAAAMVRDYIKWDDTPISLHAFRRVGGARLQDRDDAADGAGGAGRRRRSAGESPSRIGRSCAFRS